MSDPDYFLEIESHFAERRGTPFILSGRDWLLMESWAEAGVPLSVVIEAIDRCFDKRAESKRRGKISSLTFCKHAVIELWEERKDLLVGAEGSVPEVDAAKILQRLAAALDAAPTEDDVARRISETSAKIRELSGRAASVTETEETLMAMEESLLADVIALFSESDRRELDAEVDRMLSGFDQIAEATRKRTREANLKRIVRSRFGIPRLSLFA